METNSLNIYLFKAMDAYPFELERTVEALNYALSFDPENVKALCLMARLYSEQLGDHSEAKLYYERAIASRMDIPNVYPEYIRTLLMNDDFEEAKKLIDFALTVKGIDKAGIYLTRAQLFESIQKFDKAIDALKEAKQFALNNQFMDYADEVLNRLKTKREHVNNKKRTEPEAGKEKTELTASDKSWFKSRLNNLL